MATSSGNARQRRDSPRLFGHAVVRITTGIFAALLSLSLGACATYHAQPVHPQRSAAAFAARRLDAPALRRAVVPLLPHSPPQWPPQHWNRAQLFAVALADNPQLDVARAQVARSTAHEITVGEIPNPTISLLSEYALHDVKPWLYGVSFDIPLRSPGQKRLETEVAQLTTRAARFKLMAKTWAMRQQLTVALSQWQLTKRRSALLGELVAKRQQQTALEQARVTAGEDSADALVAPQRALAKARQQHMQLKIESANAQASVAAALGLPPQALDGLQLDWPSWGAPPPVDTAQLHRARSQALLSRADLAAAITRYAASERRLQLAIAQQYPHFSLSPGYYWDHGVRKFPFNISFTLPIFNQNQGPIAEARAARSLAGKSMLALQDQIYGAIAAAHRAETVARGNLDAANRQLAQARQTAHRARAQLRAGAIGRIAQVNAQATVLEAALNRLTVQAQLQTARNQLENALHAPLSGPELKLRRHAPATRIKSETRS